MNIQINDLNMELQEIEDSLVKIIELCNRQLVEIPEGNLRIAGSKNGFACYIKSNRDVEPKNGKYLKKNDRELARRIAQRDYDKSVLKEAQELLQIIQKVKKKNYIHNIKNKYDMLNEYRQTLVNPCVISDEQYSRLWSSITYQQKAFDDDKEIYTERGERVRSKTEKIIADKLYFENIPYRYEYPLILNGYGKIYPDFLVLNKRTRKEYYWEHLGMMDNYEYMEKSILKLETYEKNGYIPGKNLILTHETQTRYLSGKVINDIIESFLK